MKRITIIYFIFISLALGQQRSPNMWIKYRNPNENLFQGLFSPDDKLEPVKAYQDVEGITHYRYQHFHKNLLVEGSELIYHKRGNKLLATTGHIASLENREVIPLITPSEALNSILKLVKAEQYIWEDSGSPYFNKLPAPQLMFAMKKNNGNFVDSNYVLAYKTTIITTRPFYSNFSVYTNAMSGEIFRVENNIRSMLPYSSDKSNPCSNETTRYLSRKFLVLSSL